MTEFSAWLPKALTEHVEAGHAVLSIYANDPDLLKNEPPEDVGTLQTATSRAMQPFRELISRNQTNWAVIAAAGSGWAAKVFPDRRPDEQIARLWDEINRLCRLDRPDPVAAWQKHIDDLAARADYLNRQHYDALRYSGPGTNLTIGLPEAHVWVSGHTTSRSGIQFTANLPTEEVFTIPHKDRVDGTVRSTKPLSYGGTLIEDFSLRFSGGRVVEVKAARGETVLRQLVETDPGAVSSGKSRSSRTAHRCRRLAGCSTTRSSTKTPRPTWRSAPRTSSRCGERNRWTRTRSDAPAATAASSTSIS